MHRRHLLPALLILGLTACGPGDGEAAPAPSAEPIDPSMPPTEHDTQRGNSMSCPDTYDHELRNGVVGPHGSTLPRTTSGARLELTANVIDDGAEPATTNIAWQTSPPSDLLGTDRVWMKQQVGDVLEVGGVHLEITGICAGRVTLDEVG